MLHSPLKNNTETVLVYRSILNRDEGTFQFVAALNGDPNQKILIGNYRGVPSISRDGNYLVVSCLDNDKKLCILDIHDLKSATPGLSKPVNPIIIKTIDLPKSCQDMLSNQGVESISWSFNDTKLAVVCSNNFHSKEREACIIPFESPISASCFVSSTSDEISRVEWSPIDDQLLVSSSGGYFSKIYLLDPIERTPHYVTNGWGASWSPDGKQIAFIQWQEDYFGLSSDGKVIFKTTGATWAGLAIINKDGTNLRWLYRPGYEQDDSKRIVSGCEDALAVCNTSWSPDGKQIAFAGRSGGMYNFHIFKYNMYLGRAEQITFSDDPNVLYTRSYSAPQWGR